MNIILLTNICLIYLKCKPEQLIPEKIPAPPARPFNNFLIKKLYSSLSNLEHSLMHIQNNKTITNIRYIIII